MIEFDVDMGYLLEEGELEQRIEQLESLVRDWHGFANSNGLDQSCADYDEWLELERRMAVLGLLGGGR